MTAGRTTKFDPKKILIVLHGSIGDVTRALPLAHLVRRGFPRAYLAWCIEPMSLPLIQGLTDVDEIIVFERPQGWRAFLSFLSKVRAGRFDLVLDLQRHLKSGLISRCSGAPQRLGFHRSDSKELNWLFNNLHIDPFGERISKLDHYLKFAEYLGIDSSPIEWRISLSAAETAAVAAHLSEIKQPYGVLFVGTRWESKQWFPHQMAECARLLGTHHGLGTILLGGKEEQELARQASAQFDGIFNLVGRTSLREAIGIIEKAKVAVGPDTGLMHIAAAVGTPVISLWGATDPERTGPHGFAHLTIQGQASCVPCRRRHCPIGRVCMQSITMEQIGAKIDLALAPDGADHTHHVEAV